MSTTLRVTWKDRSKELSSLKWLLDSLLADGTNYPALTTAIGNVLVALNGVTLGNLYKHTVQVVNNTWTNAVPTTGWRERKVLVRYQDDSTLKVGWFEIPCIDDTKFPWLAGSDFVDLNNATIAEFNALLAAINTDFLSPLGNNVTVIEMEGVGRST